MDKWLYPLYKMWGEITYPFPNFNDPVKFGNWCVILSHTLLDMCFLCTVGLNSNHVNKGAPELTTLKLTIS